MITRWARRHAAGWAAGGLAVTVAGTAGLLIALAAGPPEQVRGQLVTAIFTIVPYGLAGSALISRRPDLPFGWLLGGAAAALVLCFAAMGAALTAVEHGHTGPLVALGLSLSGLAFLPIGIQGLINVRFPSGRPATRWGRALEIVLVAGLVLVVVGGVIGAGSVPGLLPDSAPARLRRPLFGGDEVTAAAQALVFVAPVLVLLGLVAGLGVVVRCWRATGIERQQLKWRAAGVVVALGLFPLAVTERLGPVLDALDSSVFVATLAIPVLRYRLWAIDVIIRRSAVYAGVTAVLVALYVLVSGIVAGRASERVGASIAAAGVALAIVPVRGASQRFVDRLFYGSRSDPYRALAEVGHRLDAAGDVLPSVVTAIAESLRLPYVAIERPGDGALLAACGDPRWRTAGACERWPLTYQGAPVGYLTASPRRGEAAFDERDRQVLADIARQAGPAVRAEALTADLLAARQRLVTAREEDRRRLRRDLHDGLGPMLTGLGLNLDAARARLAAPGSDPAQVDEFLAYAKDAAVQVITDLRGMVYDLRPPALDDLGLVGALRLHAERLGAGAGMRVEVAADGLPDLPAAIEVAAFRTAVEALTNAARHGAAATCTIRLAAVGGPALVLDVTDHEPRRDQARKRPPEWLPGVGITAMRERAEELGGTLLAGPTATGGRVTARYPWPTRDGGEGPGKPAPVVPDRKGTDEELSEVAP